MGRGRMGRNGPENAQNGRKGRRYGGVGCGAKPFVLRPHSECFPDNRHF